MSFATTPLSPTVVGTVTRAWEPESAGGGGTGDEPGAAVRLHGGEESAAYRLGDRVIRVGPVGRSTAEAEWCHAVARRASVGGAAEAVVPLPTRDGATVVRVEGRPVSVWPYVEGDWPDRDDPAQRVEAARTLGRLHRALATDPTPLPPRPAPSILEPGLYGERWAGHPNLRDDDLDRWLAAFHVRRPLTHPLHGDYYRANLLSRHGRLVAVLDWDEALVGPPALEAATAAREFGDPWTTDFEPAREFVAEYAAAGGTAGPLDDEALAQFIRHRLRCEANWFERHAAAGGPVDPEDAEYHRRRMELFRRLRP